MSQWLSEVIYVDTAAYFESIQRDIQHAQRSIEVESYIFDLSVRPHQLLNHLTAASQRGVAVRILVDGFGSAPHCAELKSLFAAHPNIQFRIYHPLLHVGLLRFFNTFNRRNHRKMWIFDQETAYVGSANIQTNDWIEFGLRVSGPETAELGAAFELAWVPMKKRIRAIAGGLLKPKQPAALLLLNDSIFSRESAYRYLSQRIIHAKDTVCIVNAYFAPRFRFIRLLTQARHRGVDIRLIVPARSDIFFMVWLTRAYYSLLIAAGVRVFEHSGPFLHAKSCAADDWMIVGSTNLNRRSLLKDLEVDLVVTQPENQALLLSQFDFLVSHSQPMTQSQLDARTFLERMIYRLLFSLRNWL